MSNDTASQGAGDPTPPTPAPAPRPPPPTVEERQLAIRQKEAANNDPARTAAAAQIGTFELAQREATAMAQSSVLPIAFRQYNDENKENPDAIANCMIAIEFARRLGMAPLAVIQNMHVIHGRPGLSSSFLIGTVNASKRFSPLRFRWVGERGKDSFGCQAFATSKEDNEMCEGVIVDWTMVKAEGWDKKKGSKWLTMPDQMFMYRAASFWTRIYAPETSMGIRPADELEDMFAEPTGPQLTPMSAKTLDEKFAPKVEVTGPGVVLQSSSKATAGAKPQQTPEPKPAEPAAAKPAPAKPKPPPSTPKADPNLHPAGEKIQEQARAAGKPTPARDGSDGSVPADQEPPETGDEWPEGRS